MTCKPTDVEQNRQSVLDDKTTREKFENEAARITGFYENAHDAELNMDICDTDDDELELVITIVDSPNNERMRLIRDLFRRETKFGQLYVHDLDSTKIVLRELYPEEADV